MDETSLRVEMTALSPTRGRIPRRGRQASGAYASVSTPRGPPLSLWHGGCNFLFPRGVRRLARRAEKMKPNDVEAAEFVENSRLAFKILDYFHRYPQAKDTVEGIAKWWVQEDAIEVRRVLDKLVDLGLVGKRSNAALALYYAVSRNRAEEEKGAPTAGCRLTLHACNFGDLRSNRAAVVRDLPWALDLFRPSPLDAGKRSVRCASDRRLAVKERGEVARRLGICGRVPASISHDHHGIADDAENDRHLPQDQEGIGGGGPLEQRSRDAKTQIDQIDDGDRFFFPHSETQQAMVKVVATGVNDPLGQVSNQAFAKSHDGYQNHVEDGHRHDQHRDDQILGTVLRPVSGHRQRSQDEPEESRPAVTQKDLSRSISSMWFVIVREEPGRRRHDREGE